MTLNNHHQGVTPSDYSKNPKLPNVVNILSTNRDRKGKEFISTVEGAKGLPVWATQFHPEKNIFEQARNLHGGWPSEAIAHSRAAVAVSQEADLDDSVPGQRVIVYDAATFTSTGEAYQLKGLDDEGIEHNSGLEGVAYDRLTMTFYVAREGKRDAFPMLAHTETLECVGLSGDFPFAASGAIDAKQETKQKHYDESKQASNPSRAARDGAYARTAMPKFSGGGSGSASTTRSIS